MDANLKVVVSKDDSGLKELLKSLADLQSLFGGAIPAAVEKGAAALKELLKSLADLQSLFGGAIPAAVEKGAAAMKQSHAKVVESVKQGNAAIIAETTSANEKLKQVTERREQFEKQAEALKFEELKGKYKELVTAHQNAQQAMREATSKEQKAELAEVEKTLKQEKQAYADTLRERPETKKGKASDVGMLGTKREVEGSGKGLLEVAGIGAGVEGLKMLTEKSEEAAKSQQALSRGTGDTGKQLEEDAKAAEALGDKYKTSGENVQVTMGKVAAATGATGEELNKQTEAVVAYALANNKSSEAVAKQMQTEAGRAKIFADAKLNEAKAQQAANTPAAQAQFIQEKLTETLGKVAMVTLSALGPAMSAITPLLSTIGDLVDSVVKPALDALTPVMALIGKSFSDLAPVIVHLIEGALKLISPVIGALSGVLGDLIPVIITAVKTVGDSLTPVFDALVPVIKTVAGMFAGELGMVLQTTLIPVLNILVPIIRDVLAPVLLALMPLLQMVADLASSLLTPALKLVSGILQFIVSNAIQPLVKWLSGELTEAIKTTVGVITTAVGAITKVVGAITSFLGLGDKAAAATKDAGAKVLDADQQNADALAKQKETQDLKAAQRERIALVAKLAHGTLSAAESAKLRAFAQNEEDDAMLAKLDAFDAKKAKQGSSGAKKAAKDKFTVLREAADEELELEKDSIIESGKTGAEAKAAEMAAEIVHQQAMLDIAEQQYGKASAQFRSAHAKLKQDRQALAEDTKNELIEEGKRNTETELSELDTRAIKENLTEKQVSEQRFQIVQQGLKDEIAYRKSWGEDVSKLQAQLDQGELKHADDIAKARKKIAEGIGKENLEAQRQYLDLERQQLQASGKSTEEIDAQLNKLDQDAEDKRYKDELESRKDDLADTVLGHNLKESLEANHQGKLLAIQKKGYDAQLAADKEKISFITGPLANAFAKTGDAINQKFFTPMLEKALGGKNIFSGFISEVVGGLVKTGVAIATQFATNAVLQAAFGAASVATATATNAGILATAAPAAAAESVATLGVAPTVGSTALLTSMSSLIPALLAFLPGHAAGTDSSPGGWHWTGELGPELVNMTPGARVIPNSALNSFPISPASTGSHDMFAAHADRIIQAIHSSGNTVATAAARRMTGIPINDQWRAVQNNSAKAEDRRSF